MHDEYRRIRDMHAHTANLLIDERSKPQPDMEKVKSLSNTIFKLGARLDDYLLNDE
ncbi:hypothetical protein [Listeria booriae]|uniref:hypothetical protein n=1 Tax=Listeria booriae TaxID=1552123 RepID=UPI00162710D2|nr:hypothetical protein [Listeria booriae]MBC2164944.1 hypothetical protein [Listeria booriae]